MEKEQEKNPMNIKIENDKTIKEELSIKLGKFTIFAGENNSGKTQIINELAIKLEAENNVIKIPAEKVILENEIKTSTAKDKFRETLNSLINLTIKAEAINITNGIDDIETKLPELFDELGVNKIKLNVTKGVPKDEEYEKAIKDVFIKKALDSITIEDELSKKLEIKLEDAGQGTERLVIVSLIRYLASKLKEENKEKETYLIIEEPEIFLHPKLKKTFNKALKDISKTINIILTTHDPYFITLNENEKIYRVCRKIENTQIEEIKSENRLIGYNSHAEINYLIFDLPTIEFHNELYGFLKEQAKGEAEKNGSVDKFEDWLVNNLSVTVDKNWIKVKPDNTEKELKVTLQTYIRHSTHHPENTKNTSHTPEDLRSSIETMYNFKKLFEKQGNPEMVKECEDQIKNNG